MVLTCIGPGGILVCGGRTRGPPTRPWPPRRPSSSSSRSPSTHPST